MSSETAVCSDLLLPYLDGTACWGQRRGPAQRDRHLPDLASSRRPHLDPTSRSHWNQPERRTAATFLGKTEERSRTLNLNSR